MKFATKTFPFSNVFSKENKDVPKKKRIILKYKLRSKKVVDMRMHFCFIEKTFNLVNFFQVEAVFHVRLH